MDLRVFVPVRLNFAVNIKVCLLFPRKGVIILFKPLYLIIQPGRVKIYRLCSVCIMGQHEGQKAIYVQIVNIAQNNPNG